MDLSNRWDMILRYWEQLLLGVDRLERLAKFLETDVDPEKFTMNFFANGPDPTAPDFVGCALAHSVRLFEEDGLKIVQDPGGYTVVYHEPHGDITSVHDFFKLNWGEVSFIFYRHIHDRSHNTIPATVERIRQTILDIRIYRLNEEWLGIHFPMNERIRTHTNGRIIWE